MHLRLGTSNEKLAGGKVGTSQHLPRDMTMEKSSCFIIPRVMVSDKQKIQSEP
jgi:hypothetical protein